MVWLRRRPLVALYLGLLAISTLVRLAADVEPPSGRRSVQTSAFVGFEEAEANGAKVAYLEWPSQADSAAAADEPATVNVIEEAPPLVLVHGSPGSARNFGSVGPLLAQDRRVLALDLPGFGASSQAVPDYSIVAHAGYLLALLDNLGIERAHLLGFSMGGGVVLHLAEHAPERVASITMMSAIGVQELELLGSYRVNHWIHRAQLWLLAGLRWGTPHFGLFDGGGLSYTYARNFLDTDQRPLRAILQRLDAPLMILHGKQDPLVPVEAAVEHARLAPHSELVVRSDSHFFVFQQPTETATTIADFLRRVDVGQAASRAQAEPQRIVAAAAPFDTALLPRWSGPAVLVVFALLTIATFVSEDLTCLAAGLLVAQGRLTFTVAWIACYLGILIGDLLLFWAGRNLGRRILRKPPLRWWIHPRALRNSSIWLQRRGAWVIVLSRFLPGARLPTNLAAGLLRTSAWRFLGYFALAGLLWTPLFVWVCARLGEQVLPWLGGLRHRILLIVLLLGLVMFVVRRGILPLFTWRGRRRWTGRWRRWTRWEFWPSWAIYLPLLPTLLRCGLRHSGLTVFTCANPSFPAGGVVGESKSAILSLVPEELVPEWRLLESSDQAGATLRRLVQQEGWTFPLVIKPDVGERGKNVAVVRSLEEAAAALDSQRWPVIVQRYAGGDEYSLFWSQGPDDHEGELISLTHKQAPILVGDGERSLERLIYEDDRAVALADVYLAEPANDPEWVPEPGERIRLVEVGAHARGTIFLDAEELRTAELVEALQNTVTRIPGFDFGRLDVKVPDAEALRQGRDLQILEINGVTSEATHMYDPRYSLSAARRILADQWRRAYAIGAQRRARGQQPTSLLGLLELWLRTRLGLARRIPPSTAVGAPPQALP